MTKSIYLLPLILTFMITSQLAAYGQNTVKSVEAGPNERFEITKSTVSAKRSAIANMAMTRLADPGEQTGQTSSASQTNNSSYVFPTAKQRFHRYVKNTVGPFSLLRSAASAGLQQWDNSPVEWGQGMEGYGKRFASSVGSNAIRQTVTYGLSEAFRLDTGFERSKHTKFWPRVSDALVQNVTSRTRSGKRVISAPILIGTYAGTIIPNETWYPERYSYKDGLRGGSYTLLMGFGVNLVREFLFNW
jgi:hypothetical protein